MYGYLTTHDYAFRAIWYILGLIGSIFLRIIFYLAACEWERREQGFQTSRGLFLLMMIVVILGPFGFGLFLTVLTMIWVVEDPTGFWKKPICSCFDKKGK